MLLRIVKKQKQQTFVKIEKTTTNKVQASFKNIFFKKIVFDKVRIDNIKRKKKNCT